MKKTIRLFTTLMVCMAMALCVSCKKDNAEPNDGNIGGGGNTGGGGGGAGGHEYVDLGLPSGTLWATCNVGADSPEDYGNYYAWGETETKEYYDWSTYKWCNGSHNTFTKYCTNSSCGTVDNKTVLEMGDDAARANWGGDWRMPTLGEMDELRYNCTWEWTTQNGMNGYRVTGSNGNSIFLPAAGGYSYGSLIEVGSTSAYWSSSLHIDADYAYWLGFYSYIVFMNSYKCDRYVGLSIRPVYGAHAPVVTTSSILDITQTTAACVGNVTSDGGANVTARGVCWSTSQNPTVSDSHTTDGTGTGSFTSSITGLTANTTYYVRAYATNSAGTGYGEQKSFTTQSGGGSIGCVGCFSVSHTATVEFAPGNLYWDGSAFRFEENQWSFESTWDANHVSHFYWSKTASVAYAENYSDSGASTSDVFFTNATHTTANPGFHVNGETGDNAWRTLAANEWSYLLRNRANAESLCACKELDNGTHNGLVILPDGTDASVMENITSTSDLATYGAVFLPAAGGRYGTDVYDAGSSGGYWSSTPYEVYEDRAYYMYFGPGDVTTHYGNRVDGYAVRLVR